MTQDLTKIEKPLGLLDKETQEALRAHGGPYESYAIDGWGDKPNCCWFADTVYRVKPPPPKPREWWINKYHHGVNIHDAKEKAEKYAASDRIECIHVREVLE